MERGDARGSSPHDSCMEAIELLKPSVIACRIFAVPMPEGAKKKKGKTKRVKKVIACRIFAVPMPEGVSVGVFLHGKNIFTRQHFYTAKCLRGGSGVGCRV